MFVCFLGAIMSVLCGCTESATLRKSIFSQMAAVTRVPKELWSVRFANLATLASLVSLRSLACLASLTRFASLASCACLASHVSLTGKVSHPKDFAGQ